jgi:hypothetical protein
MKSLFLFLMLLFGLLLCSFLGTTFGREGLTNNISNSTVYTGHNGTVTIDSSSQLITLQLINVLDPIVLTKSPTNNYTNAAGYNATISNGTITITSPNNGATYTFTIGTSATSTTSTTPYDNYNHYTASGSTITFYGPSGSTAQLISGPNGNQLLVINGSIYNSNYVNTFIGPNGGTATIVTGTDGNKIIQVKTSSGTVTYTIQPTITTNIQPINDLSSLPPGILESQIPPGQEDLYILKSQIIPPVYPPVCQVIPRPNSSNSNNNNNSSNSNNNNNSSNSNNNNNNSSNSSAPAKPMTYKAVPNYNAIDPDLLPQPVLSDFSSFGM